jgi:hypothetical protein
MMRQTQQPHLRFSAAPPTTRGLSPRAAFQSPLKLACVPDHLASNLTGNRIHFSQAKIPFSPVRMASVMRSFVYDVETTYTCRKAARKEHELPH